MTHIRNRQYTHEELQNLKGLDQMEFNVAFNTYKDSNGKNRYWTEEDYKDSYNNLATIYNTLGLKQFPIIDKPISARTYANGLLYFDKRITKEKRKFGIEIENPKPAIKRKYKKETGNPYNFNFEEKMKMTINQKYKERVGKVLFFRKLKN